MKGTTRRKRNGFTLLELLMVVIIIAILAAIALPQYIKVTERARGAEALQIVGAIRSAEGRYRAQNPNGFYGDLADLDIDVPPAAASASWDVANPSISGSGSAVGSATVARLGAGTYAGQIVGITFGTGTVCGDFVPMSLAACTDD